MAFTKPIILEIGDGVYAINEFGLDAMYVVCGEREALVIDTGMGYCDFRAIVEGLTKLPYRVVLTHGHVDHAGGMDQFDEVYLHPLDQCAARAITLEQRDRSGAQMHGREGDADVWSYGPENIRPWEKQPRFLDLYDGQTFPLGGRCVTTVFTPGHSAGSCCFIDDKSRILFSGDACNVSLMLSTGYISQELEGLYNLKRHQAEFDQNFNGHIAYSSNMQHLSMPATILDDSIEACRRILLGQAKGLTTFPSRFTPGANMHGYSFGTVQISYNEQLLWREGTDRTKLLEGGI